MTRWLSQFAFGAATLERIRERAPLVAPLAALAVVNLAVALAMWRPLSRGLAFRPENVRQTLNVAFWLVAIFYPVIALAKTLLLAAFAWGLIALMGQVARLRTLFSLLLFGELLLQLPGIFTALVLNLQGVDRIRQAADLLVPWGVDMLVQLNSPVALAAAQSATIFHLLWFGFLTVALPRVSQCSRAGAVVTATTLWGGMVAFNVLRSLLAG